MEHISVLLREVVEGLAPPANGHCIDGTVGASGHAEALLEATAPAGRLLGLDADPAAIGLSRTRLAHFGQQVILVNASFTRMEEIARSFDFSGAHAILLDLGISSLQLADPARGFSLQLSGPLDMRMDPTTSLTAEEIVNDWSQEMLADVIYRFGEEPGSRRIARAIVAARPVRTTDQLAAVVSRAGGHTGGRHRIHPATRVFQALRIRVNDELAALEAVLPQMTSLLAPAGRFAVISFHSLEDRLVKQYIQRETRDCLCPPELPECRCGHRATLRAVTRKPARPAEDELGSNPRSRSARLRIAERL